MFPGPPAARGLNGKLDSIAGSIVFCLLDKVGSLTSGQSSGRVRRFAFGIFCIVGSGEVLVKCVSYVWRDGMNGKASVVWQAMAMTIHD